MIDVNPFKDPGPSLAPPPARSTSVWSRIGWFAFGFAASWVVWSIVSFAAYRSRDYTQKWPDELREEAPEWLRKAKGRKVGQFVILAADHATRASCLVHPAAFSRKPEVGFEDQDSDGRVDSVIVTDGHHVFEFVTKDGGIVSYSFAPDFFALDSVSYFDHDMDGAFDYRFGPGRQSALMVDSQWQKLVAEGGGKGYVEVAGERREAEYVEGKWRLID